ncbi:2587_t:CDS:1 [Funneliformis mosseae]|uniref:2587_t:CDS:1 n=2 Tax=Funneliformis TaxID=1117308 RepID=A0A9N9B258_FUNMO|nr:2587_t:CDS:1 [Funneliformis mosseae]
MKMKNNMFSRNRKIHNPFKRRNSSSKSHAHPVYHQNVISALGGIPHDYDFEYSSTTETPTVYSSRRSSIYCDSSYQSSRLGSTHMYSLYQEPQHDFLAAATHTHHHHNDKCCHDANCKQYKQTKRNSSDSYNPRRSFTGFKLWLRLTWVKVGRTFR